MSLIVISFALLIWLFISTSYFPNLLVQKVEQENRSLKVSNLDRRRQYYIFVLAAGYENDKDLPAIGKLNLVTLGRLSEAIRISRNLENFILVTSGRTCYRTTSQATVIKNAAIELGVDANCIETLERPSNTLEEAESFSKRFGNVPNLILVTDALHMPRALKIFRSFKMLPMAAPANFKVKFGANSFNGLTMPKMKSLNLFRLWFYEKVKTLIFDISK